MVTMAGRRCCVTYAGAKSDQMSWNNDFWTPLAGDQPSLRFDMYYRKREDLRLPVEVVAWTSTSSASLWSVVRPECSGGGPVRGGFRPSPLRKVRRVQPLSAQHRADSSDFCRGGRGCQDPQLVRGRVGGLTPKKRGRKAAITNPLEKENTELKRALAKAELRSKRAEALVVVQKSIGAVGHPAAEGGRDAMINTTVPS